MSSVPSICVVTNPMSGSGSTVHNFLDTLSAVTTVSLLTAGLDEDAPLRDEHEVVDLTSAGHTQHIVIAMVRFLVNQMRMCRAIRRRDEDVIWFFGATAYLVPMVFARLSGKTVVVQPRGDIPLTFRLQWGAKYPDPIARFLAGCIWLLERLGYHTGTAIVTYTPSMATQLNLEQFESKLYTNGARFVDLDRFSPQIPYDDRDCRIGFVGRLEEEKNIRQLAAVTRNVTAEVDDVTFTFVGDGELRPWLESELEKEIEHGDVELTGWIDHETVPTQLSRFQLLVLPSEPTEGLPTIILEAFACGTPVYASPVSGVPDVVIDDETGFLLNEESVEAMTRDVCSIITRTDLEAISESCQKLAAEEFSRSAAANRYRSVLEEIHDSSARVA